MFDPIPQIVYAASSEQVTDVWVAGRHLVSEGVPGRLDLEDIRARATAWQERIAADVVRA